MWRPVPFNGPISCRERTRGIYRLQGVAAGYGACVRRYAKMRSGRIDMSGDVIFLLYLLSAGAFAICSIWIGPRIWLDEVERIGMQRCTPVGYVPNGIGGIFWLLGILAFFGMPVYLAYRGIAGTFFSWSLLWLLAAPFLIVLVGPLLIGGS